jgi:hypothetical protein
MTLFELRDRWLSEASHVRPYNAGAAVAFETAARELEDAMRAMDGEVLTLAEAARESGYSVDHLRHLIASHQISNAGRKGSPRIARKDLPKRAGKVGAMGYDPAADALSLVSRHRSA